MINQTVIQILVHNLLVYIRIYFYYADSHDFLFEFECNCSLDLEPKIQMIHIFQIFSTHSSTENVFSTLSKIFIKTDKDFQEFDNLDIVLFYRKYEPSKKMIYSQSILFVLCSWVESVWPYLTKSIFCFQIWSISKDMNAKIVFLLICLLFLLISLCRSPCCFL